MTDHFLPRPPAASPSRHVHLREPHGVRRDAARRPARLRRAARPGRGPRGAARGTGTRRRPYDTSDYYGPHVTNRLIREALYPYPEGLTLVTKIGAWRDDKGGWVLDLSPAFLRKSVEDNLERLGLDRMSIVNLRIGGPEDDVATPMRMMRRMQDDGLLAQSALARSTRRS